MAMDDNGHERRQTIVNIKNITPVILTFNEEPNLERCLARLTWAEKVVVVDSGSTDGTQAIASQFPNVDWNVRRFDDHTRQWNWGIDLATTPYILSLDADYILPSDFADELSSLAEDQAAWYCRFRYCVYGHPLRASLYPPRAVLFHRDRCRYVQDGHTQMLSIKGSHATMQTVIDHDDRKPLSRWLASQEKYAALEADKLLAASPASLRIQDKLRRAVFPAAPVTFLYTLLFKGAVLDGLPGLFYTFQRTVAELILSLKLIQARLRWKE